MSWRADFQKGVAAYNNGDFATALREWTPLAEQGDADAQYNLGLMYAKGRGVPQNNIYAHMWLNIDASDEGENTAGNRDIVSKRACVRFDVAVQRGLRCIAIGLFMGSSVINAPIQLWAMLLD